MSSEKQLDRMWGAVAAAWLLAAAAGDAAAEHDHERLEPGAVSRMRLPGEQDQPAVSFDARRRQALIVFEDDARGTIAAVVGKLRGGPERPQVRLGRPRPVARAAGGDADDPAVAPIAWSGWLVVWTEDASGAADAVLARAVDRHGRARGQPVVLASGCPVHAPNIARLGLGHRFLVVWSQPFESGAPDRCNDRAGIKGTIIGSGGRRLGPVRDLTAAGLENEDPYPIFDPRTGTFLVAYEVAAGDRHGEIHAQQVARDARPIGSPLVITEDEADDPVLAYDLAGGRLLAVYENEAVNPDRIEGRHLDLRRRSVEPPFTISANLDDVEDPAIASSLGRFLVTWGEVSAAGTAVVAQWLTGAGEVRGSNRTLSERDGVQDTPTDGHRNVACSFRHVCVVLWEEEAGPGAPDVAGRVATPNGPGPPGGPGPPDGGGGRDDDDDHDDDDDDDEDDDDDD